jgi:hypothetical protein
MARRIAMARQTVHRAKSEAGYAPVPPFMAALNLLRPIVEFGKCRA